VAVFHIILNSHAAFQLILEPGLND